MHHELRKAVIAEVRQHIAEGDCPTGRSYNIEVLENVIDDISRTEATTVAGGDWVLVPREPTAAMLRAGVGQWLGRGAPSFSAGWQAYVLKTWNTMLAAAPTASAAEGGEEFAESAKSPARDERENGT
jgi:hypothetical protein